MTIRDEALVPLKRGRARSVFLDPAAGVVRKRFHHPSRLLALFDQSRARSELELLSALARRGLRVPRPLGIVSEGGAWELRMECVPDARPLSDYLRGARDGLAPPGGWARFVARAAALLAELLAAGVVHPDPHPGNVLVDPEGAPWAVDLHGARRRTLRPSEREESLVRAAAAAREELPASLRARFLVAFLAVAEQGFDVPLETLARRIEDAARERRRRIVAQGLGRWTRPSSRCALARLDGRDVLHRPDASLEELRRALATPARGALLLEERSPRALVARWLGAARLAEHGVPAARPVALQRGRGGRALLSLPADAELAPRPPAASLGRLLGVLHDRGLDPARLAPRAWRARADGSLVLADPGPLREIDPRPGRVERARRFASLGTALPSGEDWEPFARAYAAAFCGTADERAELARELLTDARPPTP